MSPVLPPSSRTDKAASISGRSARALRNWIASKRFDFPVPFAPATHVKGPKLTSTSTRFLKPETLRRVSILSPRLYAHTVVQPLSLHHITEVHRAVKSRIGNANGLFAPQPCTRPGARRSAVRRSLDRPFRRGEGGLPRVPRGEGRGSGASWGTGWPSGGHTRR